VFHFVPKPMPIGLAGTHGLPVGLQFIILVFIIYQIYSVLKYIMNKESIVH